MRFAWSCETSLRGRSGAAYAVSRGSGWRGACAAQRCEHRPLAPRRSGQPVEAKSENLIRVVVDPVGVLVDDAEKVRDETARFEIAGDRAKDHEERGLERCRSECAFGDGALIDVLDLLDGRSEPARGEPFALPDFRCAVIAHEAIRRAVGG